MNAMNSEFDRTNAEAFADRIGNLVNDGAIAVMLSIGHRLGLLDALHEIGPATSARLAGETGLAERYVREWLAVLVTGGIVAYRPDDAHYALPVDHAACLTTGAELGNLAVFAQHVALLGQMQNLALTLFETGQGTGYDDYPCFHQIMAEDSAQTVTSALFDHIVPLAEGLADRLEQGIDVLDAGCGRGSALIALAQAYPQSRFTGYDLDGDTIEFARAVVRNKGLDNVTFETRDLTGFRAPGHFDLITSFDAVHDQKDPADLIRGFRASLRPNGVYLMQDIGGSAHLENNVDFPMASLLYAISCLHCTPISLGQGGAGLGTMWGWETAEQMLREAGFQSVERHILPHDPTNVWFVSRT